MTRKNDAKNARIPLENDRKTEIIKDSRPRTANMFEDFLDTLVHSPDIYKDEVHLPSDLESLNGAVPLGKILLLFNKINKGQGLTNKEAAQLIRKMDGKYILSMPRGVTSVRYVSSKFHVDSGSDMVNKVVSEIEKESEVTSDDSNWLYENDNENETKKDGE
jgi:hypothetical protein